MADCVGHAAISVAENVLTVDVWCTGTCEHGACRAAWLSSDDVGELHFRNGFASEKDGVVHQIRQYEIRGTAENPKIQFSCNCGDIAKIYTLPIERLERARGVGDTIIEVIKVILTLGIPLVITLLTRKPVSGPVSDALQGMTAELGKTPK